MIFEDEEKFDTEAECKAFVRGLKFCHFVCKTNVIPFDGKWIVEVEYEDDESTPDIPA